MGKPAIQTIVRDISERKRSELIQGVLFNIASAVITTHNTEELISFIHHQIEALIDTSNFYIALYDENTDMLTSPFVKDEKDDIDIWPAQKSLTGYMIRQKKSLLVERNEILRLYRKGEIDMVGTPAQVWLGVPLKSEGKVTGAIVVQSYTDENAFSLKDVNLLEFISHQVSISIERKIAEQGIKAALIKAQESDRLKSLFLATMSHELRTPLNSIIGFSDLIDDSVAINEIVKYAAIIHQNGEHLLQLVMDIFDITLIETGQSKYHREAFLLKNWLNEIYATISSEQFKMGKGNIELIMQPAHDNDDIIVYTDPHKLKQVFINLLKNALKFTPAGSIKFGSCCNGDQLLPSSVE